MKHYTGFFPFWARAALVVVVAVCGTSLASAETGNDADRVPVVRRYGESENNTLARQLILVDNGRFSMGFAFSLGFSVEAIAWHGDWKQQGKKLCLTPDAPAFNLYARPEPSDQGMILDWEEAETPPAFAWSPHPDAKVPEHFLIADAIGHFVLPAEAQTLFVAHPPPNAAKAKPEALEIRRYPLTPGRHYRLQSVGGMGGTQKKYQNEMPPEEMRMMQTFLSLTLFTEYKTLALDGLKGADEAEGQKLQAALEKQQPPYCGTLNQERLKVDFAPELNKTPEERAQYAEIARELRKSSSIAESLTVDGQTFTRVGSTAVKRHTPTFAALTACIAKLKAELAQEKDSARIWQTLWKHCAPGAD